MYIVDIQEMVSIELVQVSSIMYLYTKKCRRAWWQIELNLFTGCETVTFPFCTSGSQAGSTICRLALVLMMMVMITISNQALAWIG